MAKALKKHLSIDGQIAKMKARGLIVEDEECAKTVLERISYYRLSGENGNKRDIFETGEST